MDSVIGKGKWGFPVTNACHLQKETSGSAASTARGCRCLDEPSITGNMQ